MPSDAAAIPDDGLGDKRPEHGNLPPEASFKHSPIMIKRRQDNKVATLSSYLAIGIALLTISISVKDPQWLKVGLLVLAIVFIGTISAQLLRETRRRRNDEG
ncbi:hypothetical protein [Amycolatopsis sp. lyj-108]|uniref:hypothetical protein n=1 Tax=Amycolatopsis sp. lyj-108 TaxID=2789286 RepID=UPI00397B1039